MHCDVSAVWFNVCRNVCLRVCVCVWLNCEDTIGRVKTFICVIVKTGKVFNGEQLHIMIIQGCDYYYMSVISHHVFFLYNI